MMLTEPNLITCEHLKGKKIALLAGDGKIAEAVFRSLVSRGHTPLVFGLTEEAMQWAPAENAHRLGFGQIGFLLKTIKAHSITTVCLIGSVVRPDLPSLKFDLGGLTIVPKLLRAGFGGDDALLRMVVETFEAQGVEVVGAQDIVPDLLIPKDFVAGSKPYKGLEADLKVGLNALNAFLQLDIGQSLVVMRGQVVAVEGAEGTDGLLARIADMRQTGRIKAKVGEGVFLKGLKPHQERRVDFPAFGMRTLSALKASGLGAAGLQEAGVISANWQKIADQAKAENLHLFSFSMLQNSESA